MGQCFEASYQIKGVILEREMARISIHQIHLRMVSIKRHGIVQHAGSIVNSTDAGAFLQEHAKISAGAATNVQAIGIASAPGVFLKTSPGQAFDDLEIRTAVSMCVVVFGNDFVGLVDLQNNTSIKVMLRNVQ